MPKETGPRRYGVSCDACKFRKVKCDRQSKLDWRSVSGSEEGTACSICARRGLQCTVTPKAAVTCKRRGRRLAAYEKQQQEQQEQEHNGQGQGRHTIEIRAGEASSSSESVSTQARQVSSGQKVGVPYPEPSLNSSNCINDDKPYNIATARGLYNVEGLSRSVLDACFQSYFNYFAPCLCSLQMDILASRYQLYFKNVDRNNGMTEPFWQTSPGDAQRLDRPLSELLILAVACVGAMLLEPSSTSAYKIDKFELQDRIAVQFQRMLHQDMAKRLIFEGTDIVEACYIMSDPYLSITGNTPLSSAEHDPFHIRPNTNEGLIRLIFRLGIHRRPTLRLNCPANDLRIWQSGGQVFTEMELFRRMRIFWTTFCQNAFGSLDELKYCQLISDDDYDWDLPMFVPRRDGSYDSMVFCEHEKRKSSLSGKCSPLATDYIMGSSDKVKGQIICLQANHFDDFDVTQIQVLLRLIYVIRAISSKLVSPRSQGRSIPLSDVNKTLSALTTWYQQLPRKVAWDVHYEALAHRPANTTSIQDHAVRTGLKAHFLESLYHSIVISFWRSVDSYGVYDESDEDRVATAFTADVPVHHQDGQAFEAAAVPVASMSTNLPSMRGQFRSEYTNSVPASRAEALHCKVHNLTTKSFLRIAKIAIEAAQLKLVRASRLVYVELFHDWALWGCDLLRRLKREDSSISKDTVVSSSLLSMVLLPGCTEQDHIIQCVEDLITSLEAIDSFQGAADMGAMLRSELSKVKKDVLDERDSPPLQAYLRGVSTATGKVENSVDSYKTPRTTERLDDDTVRIPENADIRWLQDYFRLDESPTTILDSDASSHSSVLAGPATARFDLDFYDSGKSDAFADLLASGNLASSDLAADLHRNQFLAYSDAQSWADAFWQESTLYGL